jgi:hypothetical protein
MQESKTIATMILSWPGLGRTICCSKALTLRDIKTEGMYA